MNRPKPFRCYLQRQQIGYRETSCSKMDIKGKWRGTLSAYTIFHWSEFALGESQFASDKLDNGTAQTCIGSGSPLRQLELSKGSRAPETGKQLSAAAPEGCPIVYPWSSPSFLHPLSVMWHQVLFLKYLKLLLVDSKQTWMRQVFQHQKNLCIVS